MTYCQITFKEREGTPTCSLRRMKVIASNLKKYGAFLDPREKGLGFWRVQLKDTHIKKVEKILEENKLEVLKMTFSKERIALF